MSRKSVTEKLKRHGFLRTSWGATYAYVKPELGARSGGKDFSRIGIVRAKHSRRKRHWYVGDLYMTDGTPAPLEDLAGPFQNWKDAVVCYNITAGVQ